MNEIAIKSKFDEIDAKLATFKAIEDLTNKVTLDGSEYVPLNGGYKTLATTFFAGKYVEKTANYTFVDADSNYRYNFAGDNLTATIPDDLGFPIGDTLVVMQSGTGFALDKGAGVTFNSPQTLVDTENSIYLVCKTATNVYNVVQIGTASSGGSTDAEDVAFDNSSSEVFTATDLQGLGDEADELFESIIGTGLEKTGTAIALTRSKDFYNYTSPSASTSYTVTGTTIGTGASALINAPSEPTFTHASLDEYKTQRSDAFEIDTDMEVIFTIDPNGISYYFKKY